jgi:hypothetical protein
MHEINHRNTGMVCAISFHTHHPSKFLRGGITMGSSTGYYSVVIDTGTERLVHTVFAQSDYAAAREVRRMTGFMAKSDHDVSPAPWHAARLHHA